MTLSPVLSTPPVEAAKRARSVLADLYAISRRLHGELISGSVELPLDKLQPKFVGYEAVVGMIEALAHGPLKEDAGLRDIVAGMTSERKHLVFALRYPPAVDLAEDVPLLKQQAAAVLAEALDAWMRFKKKFDVDELNETAWRDRFLKSDVALRLSEFCGTASASDRYLALRLCMGAGFPVARATGAEDFFTAHAGLLAALEGSWIEQKRLRGILEAVITCVPALREERFRLHEAEVFLYALTRFSGAVKAGEPSRCLEREVFGALPDFCSYAGLKFDLAYGKRSAQELGRWLDRSRDLAQKAGKADSFKNRLIYRPAQLYTQFRILWAKKNCHDDLVVLQKAVAKSLKEAPLPHHNDGRVMTEAEYVRQQLVERLSQNFIETPPNSLPELLGNFGTLQAACALFTALAGTQRRFDLRRGAPGRAVDREKVAVTAAEDVLLAAQKKRQAEMPEGATGESLQQEVDSVLARHLACMVLQFIDVTREQLGCQLSQAEAGLLKAVGYLASLPEDSILQGAAADTCLNLSLHMFLSQTMGFLNDKARGENSSAELAQMGGLEMTIKIAPASGSTSLADCVVTQDLQRELSTCLPSALVSQSEQAPAGGGILAVLSEPVGLKFAIPWSSMPADVGNVLKVYRQSLESHISAGLKRAFANHGQPGVSFDVGVLIAKVEPAVAEACAA